MTNGIYWLWLATRPRCSARFCGHLLERFGSPEAIWRAERQEFVDIPRLNKVKMDSLMEKDLTVAQHIEETCRKQDIQIVTLADDMYPQLLREIPDPPLVLYVRGTLPDFTDRVSVSIVGTRKCTRYGKQAAWHFAGNLAQRGVIIVSGMAIGIDGTANRISPGTANTSRPCSSAKSAEISAPDFFGASTISVPFPKPVIMRLRTGKCIPFGSVPGGYSLMTAPCCIISSISCLCCHG